MALNGVQCSKNGVQCSVFCSGIPVFSVQLNKCSDFPTLQHPPFVLFGVLFDCVVFGVVFGHLSGDVVMFGFMFEFHVVLGVVFGNFTVCSVLRLGVVHPMGSHGPEWAPMGPWVTLGCPLGPLCSMASYGAHSLPWGACGRHG